MSDAAAITALPGLLRATREAVEAYPASGPVVALKWTLLGLLIGAEVTAEQIVALAPVSAVAAAHPRPQQHQQSHYAPLGAREPVIEEPRVPRHSGRDPRLPGKRPHP